MNRDKIYPQLKTYIDSIEKKFEMIPPERVAILDQLTIYINSCLEKNGKVKIIFICTHNSRRSHIAQLWAQTAAYVYGIENTFCFSGGTEATAFNSRAVKAMEDAGFKITIEEEGGNPMYNVRFSDDAPTIKAFSKVFDDSINPKKNFAAFMTCSHPDENCPFIPGADIRIPLTYDDPKDFDGTELEDEKYRERVREIGREMMFAVSRAKSRKLKA
jgi:hypothetical protein